MTRINCIPVEELTDKHLVAEYRELPRVFKLARHPKKGEVFPTQYTLGEGHVKFFYDKLMYLSVRFLKLVAEMKKWGYKPQYESAPLHEVKSITLYNNWTPDITAMHLNRMRIQERLESKNKRVSV